MGKASCIQKIEFMFKGSQGNQDEEMRRESRRRFDSKGGRAGFGFGFGTSEVL